MLWLYAEDAEYYQREFLDSLRRKWGAVLVCPSEAEVKEQIRKGESFVCIAPYLPPENFRSFFAFKELPNSRGMWTSQDTKLIEEEGSNEFDLLEKKTGFRIYKPDLEGKKLIGVGGIRRYIRSVKELVDRKLRPKGILLVGLPGTGKSFSAKVAAHELGAYLVEFNISRLLEMENPVFFLHSLFSYLEKASQSGQRFILWIDEIEKMFVGTDRKEKQVFGQLLTIMNDMNSTGYQINGIFWVTANNIAGLIEQNPEFFRKGRFDELFFIDLPREETAKEIASFYAKYYGVYYYSDDGISLEENLVYLVNNKIWVQDAMQRGSEDVKRFIYVPSEIEYIMKSLAIRSVLNRRVLAGDRETYALLYPEEYMELLRKHVGMNGSEPFKFVSEKLTRAFAQGKNVTDADLYIVLRQIEPIAISMSQALSVIWSNRRFFSPAD